VLGRMLALGVDVGRLMLVDEATGEVRWTVEAHGEDSVIEVAMSPNGGFVASVGGAEENWKLWDVASGDVWMAGARHGTGACICEVDEVGDRVFQEGCPVRAHKEGLDALTFSPCGQRLASGDNQGAVILWDAQTGRAERRMETGSGVMSLSFSFCGARLASEHEDHSIHVWDVSFSGPGALLRTIQNESLFAACLHFSPADSRTLASVSTVSNNDLVRVWDVDSGEMIRSFAGKSFAVFSPDGRTIASASTGGACDVLLTNSDTGALRLRLVGHEGYVLRASFSVDDGSKLASVSSDGTCKVWDSSTGALLRSIAVGASLRSVSWGRDWVRDTQRGVAFAMGHHPRLGESSRVLELDAGVVRMILDACDRREHQVLVPPI